MARYYYGTKSVLDWIIGHYFFHGVHYTWLADCFYPYGQGNPKSSNPLLIYQDFYQPWKDQDGFDKFIAQNRLNLIKGVISREDQRLICAEEGEELRELCNTANIIYFYPIVYRVNIDEVPDHRRQVANSGQRGSSEYLVADLGDDEFEVLFLDFDKDADFRELVKNAITQDSYLDSCQAMEMLERSRNARP